MIENQINMESRENKENLNEIVTFANRFIILFLTSYFIAKIIIGILQKILKISIFDNMTHILLPFFSLLFVLTIGSRLFRTTPKQIILGERTTSKLPIIDSILLMLSLFFFEYGIVLLSLPYLKSFSPDEFKIATKLRGRGFENQSPCFFGSVSVLHRIFYTVVQEICVI